MSAKRSKHVRYYVRAADLRLGDADYLREGGRSAGAVYLAGYAVECLLKALILSLVPVQDQPRLKNTFRGAFAHDYNALRTMYREYGGANFPRNVTRAFTMVGDWETALRYESRADVFSETDEFFEAVAIILAWAKERL